MVQIPYCDSTGKLSVRVELKNTANVFLVDSNNYRKMKAGSKFSYHGGNYSQTPVNITVSGTGRYYLIVNGSAYSYKFY
ncbi:DUF1883 domain-containing protein [Carnobacterium maltaromaticum]|uniref:DUF1883 domain-containing protein n=1 Tax=Carnobacterium maltaromaticum TaxID=2751 RepID=UPI0005529171|nr:DUF1883 domain-containing protein [Carnobacterium maltaromaticum]